MRAARAGETIKAELVILEATGTWDFGNAPGEVELGIRGSPWDIHAKDDTSDVIECHEARLAAQETQTDDVDILVAAAPQLASIRGAIETSKSVS